MCAPGSGKGDEKGGWEKGMGKAAHQLKEGVKDRGKKGLTVSMVGYKNMDKGALK